MVVYIEGPLIVMTYGPPTAQQAAEAQERANNEAASGFPVDMGATGNQAASTPQPPPDGGNGCGGAGQNLALSAGGGGADSGALTQAALHPADYRAFRQNANEQAREVVVMAALARVPYPLVVGAITFGLFNPDPAYAPTPQTVPEDRPSVLEQAGQVGLAVVVGAVITAAGPRAPPNVATYKEGSFSIVDWTGYPANLERRAGPFRIISGEEYRVARATADEANALIRKNGYRKVGEHDADRRISQQSCQRA